METTFFEFIVHHDFLLGGVAQFRAFPQRVRTSFSNLIAIFWKSSEKFWNESYRSGYWNFLKEKDQRPRHYAVAGIIREYFPERASVLEVGCGYAPALSLFPKDTTYLGIDISEEVITACRQEHQNPNIAFYALSLEDMKPDQKFDVVLASEVLYYYPIQKIPIIARMLLSHLRPQGILIVTMNKNPKSLIAWAILSRLMKQAEKMAVMNTKGSKWTICIFRHLDKE